MLISIGVNMSPSFLLAADEPHMQEVYTFGQPRRLFAVTQNQRGWMKSRNCLSVGANTRKKWQWCLDFIGLLALPLDVLICRIQKLGCTSQASSLQNKSIWHMERLQGVQEIASSVSFWFVYWEGMLCHFWLEWGVGNDAWVEAFQKQMINVPYFRAWAGLAVVCISLLLWTVPPFRFYMILHGSTELTVTRETRRTVTWYLIRHLTFKRNALFMQVCAQDW